MLMKLKQKKNKNYLGEKINFNVYFILIDERKNFEIDQSIDSLGTPYDYESIMHYGPYDFTKDGNQTIASKPPGVR